MSEKANTTNGVAKKNKLRKSEADELKIEEVTQKHILEAWGKCDIATLIFEAPMQNRKLSVTDYNSLSIEDLAQIGSGVKIVVKNGEQVEIDTKTGKTTKKKKKIEDKNEKQSISSEEKVVAKKSKAKSEETARKNTESKDEGTTKKKTKPKDEAPTKKNTKSKNEETVKKTKRITKKTSGSDREAR